VKTNPGRFKGWSKNSMAVIYYVEISWLLLESEETAELYS
jgi:hypothetical protein